MFLSRGCWKTALFVLLSIVICILLFTVSLTPRARLNLMQVVSTMFLYAARGGGVVEAGRQDAPRDPSL